MNLKKLKKHALQLIQKMKELEENSAVKITLSRHFLNFKKLKKHALQLIKKMKGLEEISAVKKTLTRYCLTVLLFLVGIQWLRPRAWLGGGG